MGCLIMVLMMMLWRWIWAWRRIECESGGTCLTCTIILHVILTQLATLDSVK